MIIDIVIYVHFLILFSSCFRIILTIRNRSNLSVHVDGDTDDDDDKDGYDDDDDYVDNVEIDDVIVCCWKKNRLIIIDHQKICCGKIIRYSTINIVKKSQNFPNGSPQNVFSF